MRDTDWQYDLEASKCRDLFKNKMIDYGTAWRILRLSSLVDQIFIKANRIRTLEEQTKQMVDDAIHLEYVAIVNYSLMSLIQIEHGADLELSMPEDDVLAHYDRHLAASRTLMQAKNHDYGEAWRMMNTSSLTDLILMKIYRLKQILQNDGKTLVSEGLEANFMDMINYALFALIQLEEQKPKAAKS